MIEKNLIKVCSQHLYASFGAFCVRIGQLFAAQWVFKISEEFQNRRHFPSKTVNCRFSNILQRLAVPRMIGHANLDAKGAKRSVKMWNTNLYKSFFKNILLYMDIIFGCQKFVYYIHMIYPGRFILVESVKVMLLQSSDVAFHSTTLPLAPVAQ